MPSALVSAFLPPRRAPHHPEPRPAEEAEKRSGPPPHAALRASGPGPAAAALSSLIVMLSGFAAMGYGPAGGAAGPSGASPPVVTAMRGAEHYCGGYEQTFHGAWTSGGGIDAPVPFRVGASADGSGCYAQLDLIAPRGLAPHELPRFRAEAKDGAWTLRYRNLVVTLDPAHGTAGYRRGSGPTFAGVLLPRPPPVQDARTAPPPPAPWRERWYGRWRGRFAGVPFRVTLRLSRSDSDPNEVRGRVSAPFFRRTFTGWFQGETLIFQWRNRHIGLTLEPRGDGLVYVDYRGRTFRFRRR